MHRLSKRAQAEASTGGAKVWGEILALAKGPGVVNLGQGFPDFAGHEKAVTTAHAAIRAGLGEQYAPIAGTSRLCDSLSALYHAMYPSVPRGPAGGGRALAPDEICVTTSGTEAIYCAVMGLVDPGDEVVFFEPFFPWYLPCIRMAGGVPKPVALRPPTFDVSATEAALREVS